MPRYVYNCPSCGVFERILSVSEHVRSLACECGQDSPQIITLPTVIIPAHMRFDAQSGYESPATGKIITNKRQRANDLAESDCVEYDPGMKQDTDRRVAEEDKKLDAAMDETFDRALETMPAIKKEKLESEMNAGLTAETVRI